jgi:hypothetical protein
MESEREVLLLPCSRCGRDTLPPTPAQMAELDREFGTIDDFVLVCSLCMTPQESAALEGPKQREPELPEHVAARQARIAKLNDARVLFFARAFSGSVWIGVGIVCGTLAGALLGVLLR